MVRTARVAITLGLLLVLMPGAAVLGALERSVPANVVDFSLTLEEIHRILEEHGAAGLPTDRAVLLDGVVAEITVIDPDPESYLAQIDLVSGRWIGLQEVRLYRAYVFVQGSAFAERISARPLPEDATGVIALNSRVIVLGSIIDVFVDEDGTRAPIIDGFDLRPIN